MACQSHKFALWKRFELIDPFLIVEEFVELFRKPSRRVVQFVETLCGHELVLREHVANRVYGTPKGQVYVSIGVARVNREVEGVAFARSPW